MITRRYAMILMAFLGLAMIRSSATLAQATTGDASPQSPADRDVKNMDQKLLDGLETGPVPGGQPAGSETKPQPNDRDKSRQEQVIDPFKRGSDTGSENPLQRIGLQMHQVRERLQQRDVSPATQQTQQKIIEDLDELIAALAERQQSEQRQRPSTSQGKKQPSTRASQQAARDSTAQAGQGESQAGETAAMRRAASEIWGHLPERLRRQMQSAGAVEFLPKYRELIEDYYRRLAEDHNHQQ